MIKKLVPLEGFYYPPDKLVEMVDNYRIVNYPFINRERDLPVARSPRFRLFMYYSDHSEDPRKDMDFRVSDFVKERVPKDGHGNEMPSDELTAFNDKFKNDPNVISAEYDEEPLMRIPAYHSPWSKRIWPYDSEGHYLVGYFLVYASRASRVFMAHNRSFQWGDDVSFSTHVANKTLLKNLVAREIHNFSDYVSDIAYDATIIDNKDGIVFHDPSFYMSRYFCVGATYEMVASTLLAKAELAYRIGYYDERGSVNFNCDMELV